MIKIALRHQVPIDRIKCILCWDSFICFIAMFVLLPPGHAHQDEYSSGTWFQPFVWGNISGIETRYPHTLDSSCNYPRICFGKNPKIEITTKIITQYLLQSTNNYYQKYSPAAFYVNQWSSNGSLHSLLNPGQPKCITNISTIEGLTFRPWKKRGNWRPSGQFYFQTPRGSFRGFTAYPRPQTTIIIILVILLNVFDEHTYIPQGYFTGNRAITWLSPLAGEWPWRIYTESVGHPQK